MFWYVVCVCVCVCVFFVTLLLFAMCIGYIITEQSKIYYVRAYISGQWLGCEPLLCQRRHLDGHWPVAATSASSTVLYVSQSGKTCGNERKMIHTSWRFSFHFDCTRLRASNSPFRWSMVLIVGCWRSVCFWLLLWCFIHASLVLWLLAMWSIHNWLGWEPW